MIARSATLRIFPSPTRQPSPALRRGRWRRKGCAPPPRPSLSCPARPDERRKRPSSERLRELDGQVADVEQRSHEQYGISDRRLALATVRRLGGDARLSTTSWDETPAAPIRQRGNTPPVAHSVRPSAPVGPKPCRRRASAGSRTDRRPGRSALYHLFLDRGRTVGETLSSRTPPPQLSSCTARVWDLLRGGFNPIAGLVKK